VLAFPPEEVVIAATFAFGIAAADAGPVLVDRAPALGSIEESTDALEDVVPMMPKHAPVAADELREFGFRLFRRQAEASSESRDVPTIYNDVIVGAAVGRTFGTVVIERCLLENWEFAFGHLSAYARTVTTKTELIVAARRLEPSILRILD
jgi:hypothetical protein